MLLSVAGVESTPTCGKKYDIIVADNIRGCTWPIGTILEFVRVGVQTKAKFWRFRDECDGSQGYLKPEHVEEFLEPMDDDESEGVPEVSDDEASLVPSASDESPQNSQVRKFTGTWQKRLCCIMCV